jgi:ketosteroid isomerase-like protein
MSAENVETMRRGYERFIATGDPPEDTIAPGFVWDMSTFRGWPERKRYEGIEGMRVFMANWTATWEDWWLEIEELLDAGNQVVAIVRQSGLSKATGLPVDVRFAQLWTLADGKQTHMRMYADPEEALRAAGLRERHPVQSDRRWPAPVTSTAGPRATRMTPRHGGSPSFRTRR